MKDNIEKKRELSILHLILIEKSCKIPQKDLIKKIFDLNQRYLFNKDLIRDFHKLTPEKEKNIKNQVSKSLGKLERENIIIKELGPMIPGKRGSRGNIIKLNKNVDTLFKILERFNSPLESSYYNSLLNFILINSKFTRDLITKDLVYDKIDKYELFILPYEKEILFKLIRSSPSALYEFLKEMENKELKTFHYNLEYDNYTKDEIEIEIKENLFMRLLGALSKDIPYIGSYPIEYEINIKFKDNWESINHNTGLFIEKDSIKKTSKPIIQKFGHGKLLYPNIGIGPLYKGI